MTEKKSVIKRVWEHLTKPEEGEAGADLSFEELMSRLRQGQEDAATEVFRRYAHRLIGLARLHLDSRLRQKVDPEDVLQSAMNSFFARHAQGQFDLNGPDSLWALLVEITLRKCGRWGERFRTGKRDLNRERPLAPADDSSDPGLAVPAADPSPSEPVLLAELIELVLHGLNERERRIVELKQQGYAVREICAQLGRSEVTVRRVLNRVRHRLERMREAENAER